VLAAGASLRPPRRAGVTEAPGVTRPLTQGDQRLAEQLLDATVAGRHQFRLGELHDVLSLPGLGRWVAEELVGLATLSSLDPGSGRVELAVLAVAPHHHGQGHGAALLEAAAESATQSGARELWLVTTNDNLDGLRLYQRHAFRLSELHAGSLDEARKAKPQMSDIGANGIPLRDELVLRRTLTP
jgi:ribosomal protein S18 acetylase RimI-like enzyme